MIHARSLEGTTPGAAGRRIGTAGHLAIFLWSLAMVMLVPAGRVHWAAALCLGGAMLVYPLSLKRLLRLRWLLLLALLALPPVFFLGQADASLLGLAVSAAGLQAGLQIALRFVVVLVAVDGFTAAVDIAALAGLFERFGLQGLGFCMGVALNLLPALQLSATNAWRSLWMRGGLRRQRRRGLRLLLVTVVSNALRRAEEIALAAEARAFSPHCARPMPLHIGRFDWLAAVLASLALLAVCVVRGAG
jgi:energy-coupling factor transporter transmembrane protein EcfT